MNIAVIQARMSSRRLPGKAMLLIDSKPVIYHVIKRGQKIYGIEKVVLATSKNKENDELSDFAKSLNTEVFREDEDNVLERFYLIAKKYKAKNIIRLTGDNPLVDFKAVSFLLGKHCQNKHDYSILDRLPIGACADIFSFNAVKKSYKNSGGEFLRDHIDLYVLENQDEFNIMRYELARDLSMYRWSVDEQCDIDMLRKFFDNASQAGAANIEDMDTSRILDLAQALGFEKYMHASQANISEKNIYTAGLIEKIARWSPVNFEDIYGKARWQNI